MKNKLLLSDLYVLLHLFAPKHYNVFFFDPEGKLEEDVKEKAYDEKGISILVNLSGEVSFLRGTSVSEYYMVLDFGNCSLGSEFSKYDLFYLNSGKDMRWMFEPGKGKSVLNFYSASDLKARVKQFILKTAFRLKLQKLVSSGNLKIYTKGQLKTNKLMAGLEYGYCAYFLGTPGINRTPLIALMNGDRVNKYVKFAFDKGGFNAIRNERMTLFMLRSVEFSSVNTPEPIDHPAENPAGHPEKAILVTSNIKPEGVKPHGESKASKLRHALKLVRSVNQTNYCSWNWIKIKTGTYQSGTGILTSH